MRVILALLLACIALGAPVRAGAAPPTRQIDVMVTDLGYEPDHLDLQAGQKVRITFQRELDDKCAETLVIPEYHVRVALPLHERVTVELTPTRAGEYSFECGMGMIHGTLLVR